MLNFGNKEFRNLQEQVLQNANDLETIKQSLGTALPNPIAGPQGPAGQSIVGPQGERGSIWTVGTDFPASPRESDLHLKNSEVYQYTNGQWVLYSSIRGTQGIQGIKGNIGDTGPMGPSGPRGEQGSASPIYQVVGKVDDISQLPAPSTVSSNSAYIIGDNIYGVVGGQWTVLTTFIDFGSASNLENGTGTNAVQMKQDGTSGVFSFTGKNPNATIFDPELTGDITYGATGNFATVVGGKAAAMGKRSMAQGTTTIAKGPYSHAEGDNSVALGGDSHAEGYATVAKGTASHSEGNNTIASGELSHAEGFSTQATGQGAHAEGAHTQAIGDYSHASGLNTIAGHNGQSVVGHCNDNKETTVFEVGCGWTDDQGVVEQRVNAFEVYLDGHAEVLTVGETDNSVPNMAVLNQMYTQINEKLEGKKSTFIADASLTIEGVKDLIISSGLRVYSTSGTDITADIMHGDYDDQGIVNDQLNTNDEVVKIYPPNKLMFVLKSIENYQPIQMAETYILGRMMDIFSRGDTILFINTDIPDRWYGGYAGGQATFYALEARKVEVGATNLKNGRDTTISVQGGTGSIANYDGDIAFGTGLETVSENQAAFGSYNAVDWTYANGRPLLTVGNGTAQSRHTAFEVYNNNSIRIGNTILTEQQLIALLSRL